MTKEKLQEYKWLSKNILRLKETLYELNQQKEFLYKSPTISSEPRSSLVENDKFALILEKIEETKEEISKKINERCLLLIEIENTIECLDGKEQYLIRSRYTQIPTHSWEQIAVDMCYSIQHVWHMHGEILKKIRENEST